jgi:L-glyceraldehyde 3-phosphate reductase
MAYIPAPNRYNESMIYSFCGKSGLQLSKIALGLWHNFGAENDFSQSSELIHFAFDQGITYFDLANNYGPPPGSAEETFGRVLKQSFSAHRDELIIATKAGHRMWEGPYGDGSSRKSLMASLDQSLKRLQLDYVDIFYSHRYDEVTPLEETLQALSDIVKSGKALYIGLSKYPAPLAAKAYEWLASHGTPCLIHQDRYNMLSRKVEKEILPTVKAYGVGFCAFSPLAQGLLSDRYLQGVPAGSRASKNQFLRQSQLTPELLSVIRQLNQLALDRQTTLAQMALSWILRDERVTSVIIGASSTQQIADNLGALKTPPFTESELQAIQQLIETIPE